MRFEFRRRLPADISYSYVPDGDPSDRVWKRVDMELWVRKIDKFGWAGVNNKAEILALPWALAPDEQGDYPPECIWVSRKNDKSYVYDLVYSNGCL